MIFADFETTGHFNMVVTGESVPKALNHLKQSERFENPFVKVFGLDPAVDSWTAI